MEAIAQQLIDKYSTVCEDFCIEYDLPSSPAMYVEGNKIYTVNSRTRSGAVGDATLIAEVEWDNSLTTWKWAWNVDPAQPMQKADLQKIKSMLDKHGLSNILLMDRSTDCAEDCLISKASALLSHDFRFVAYCLSADRESTQIVGVSNPVAYKMQK